MGAEDPATTFNRVVVGQQRVVRGVNDGLANRRAGSGDGEYHYTHRKSGHTAEQTPHQSADDGERDAL